ncbi:hypothetical protein [Streptomyces clavifer]|uniref:hypothetical protein n=1 Tax=Streptomyces clavifer TaxID=68188 RepID=UPI0033FA6AB8
MPELREHAGRHYAVQHIYSLSENSWCLELSEAVPMDTEPSSPLVHRNGRIFLAAFVPDEDPDLEPTLRIDSQGERVVPYDIVCWFMEQVAEQVARCRTAFSHGDLDVME